MMKKLVALLLCLIFLCSSAYAVAPGFAVRNGSREEKKICITVDDCKDTKTLKQIFDLGQELEVPITFFTLGYVLENTDRDLWLAIAASNCEIGNHTSYHNTLPKQSHTAGVNALLRTQAKLDELLGYHYQMQVMRPPYGEMQDASGNSSATIQIRFFPAKYPVHSFFRKPSGFFYCHRKMKGCNTFLFLQTQGCSAVGG